MWSLPDVQQAFGLLIYCSTVLDIKLWQFYHVFKFIRRRMRQMALKELTQKDKARIWPSTPPTWETWVAHIVNHHGRQPQREVQNEYVLITDASGTGFGGLLFNNRTLHTTSFAPLVSAAQATATRSGEQEGVDWKDKV
jgi:hypothetical protein